MYEKSEEKKEDALTLITVLNVQSIFVAAQPANPKQAVGGRPP